MNKKYYDSFAIMDIITELMERIGNLPAPDVVEVVRCKTCKYWAFNDLDHGVCVMHSIGGWRKIMPETAYCSMGKRKEADNG